MKRVLLSLAAIAVLGAAVAFSGPRAPAPAFQFTKEDRNPVSHFRWDRAADEFQFAIVSDRTGGHRANIFAQAVEKLNLLQPEFVISVGDLIEGTKKNNELIAQWKEFDGYLARLSVPFFYVGGNHDVGSKESAQFWQDKLGRIYYHFNYRNVLFLMLNADDPPGGGGSLDKDQVAYAQKVIEQNKDTRWTIVFLHRPLWNGNIQKNGWGDVEKALAGRPYTVFCGHIHRYQKFIRNGQNYYQLATTGGVSKLRGIDQGEFDHITWVTMKKDGPVLAHILLDSIHAEDLKKPVTNEPGKAVTRKPLQPVRGQVFFEGVPIPGAQVALLPVKVGAGAVGIAAADGSFTFTTYTANDGAVAGEYAVTVVWRVPDSQGKPGPNRLPAKYSSGGTSGLRATIEAGRANALILELKK
jgi:predicted MPP superfamily phosphohydrolase